jgi:hypothetical protein
MILTLTAKELTMEIKVYGLSALQRELADQIWACDSEEDVSEFIGALPKRLRGQARFVREMMIAAVWDNVVEEQQEFPEVMEMLDKFMK